MLTSSDVDSPQNRITYVPNQQSPDAKFVVQRRFSAYVHGTLKQSGSSWGKFFPALPLRITAVEGRIGDIDDVVRRPAKATWGLLLAQFFKLAIYVVDYSRSTFFYVYGKC